MENLMPIGQFAAASRLSLKALRLYDENRLLPPAWVDPETGYRLYSVEQLRSATLIGLLRAAGMPLVEIGRVLADPTPARIAEYEAALRSELAERRRVLAYVRSILEEEQMFDVHVKEVPEQRYVSRTNRLRVGELARFIAETLTELEAEHTPAGPGFTIFHGEVNESDDGPVEVALPVAGAAKRLPAGEVAYTIATDGQCRFPDIIGAYDAVAGWAKRNGRELAGPPREIYIAEQRWEIAWPLGERSG
jgi:DNA-binding transcriptional MerR regulator